MAAAFHSSPRLYERRVSTRNILFPSPRGVSQKSTRATRQRVESSAHPFSLQSLAMQKAKTETATMTGWINSDTLNLHQTINNSINTTTGIRNNNIINDGDATKVKYPSPSSMERLLIRDRIVLLKRDDLLHLPSSNISGNKARKFLALNNIPATEFPDAIVSYGGPQSNAMLALAAIVASKNAELAGTRPVGEDWQPSLNDDDEGGDNMFWQLDVSEEDITTTGKVKKDGNSKATGQSSSSSTSSSTTEKTCTTQKKKRFIYYTKTLPKYLRKYPNGNFLRALALGMEIRTVSYDEYDRLFGGLHGGSVMAPADLDPIVPGRSLWIPQGGACSIAQPGSNILAQEIVDYWCANGKGMPLAVCLPGGTCTTALTLHRSINKILKQRTLDGKDEMDIRLIVIPCVGDDEYAMRQMMSLDRSMGGKGRREDMPWILRPRTKVQYGSARKRSKGYFTFGEPSKAILQTYDEMNENGLFLDLLYGAPAWSLLLQHWRASSDADCPIAGRQVMYIHSGGLEGVSSQLTRYSHKGLLDPRTIQMS